MPVLPNRLQATDGGAFTSSERDERHGTVVDLASMRDFVKPRQALRIAGE